MYEEDGTGISRLKRVQDAARAAIQKLHPQDNLAIVAFAHDCQIVLPSTPLSEMTSIEQTINDIDRFNVDPGGTAMDVGIEAGLKEVEKNAGSGRLSQVVVLTDGETSGEQTCRQWAQYAAEKKVHLTCMGVGTEWNSSLIKDLAKLSEGKWYYIDVNQAQETERIFVEEFEHLAAIAFNNVQLHLRPFKDIRIKRVRQVVPVIKEMKLDETESGNLLASLGTLEH